MTSNRSVGRTAGYRGCDGAAGSDGEDGFRESYTAEAPADEVPTLAVLIAAEALIAAEQELLVIEVPVNAEVLSSAMAVTAKAPADKRLILEALTPAEVIFEAFADEAAHVDFEAEPTAGSSR